MNRIRLIYSVNTIHRQTPIVLEWAVQQGNVSPALMNYTAAVFSLGYIFTFLLNKRTYIELVTETINTFSLEIQKF